MCSLGETGAHEEISALQNPHEEISALFGSMGNWKAFGQTCRDVR